MAATAKCSKLFGINAFMKPYTHDVLDLSTIAKMLIDQKSTDNGHMFIELWLKRFGGVLF